MEAKVAKVAGDAGAGASVVLRVRCGKGFVCLRYRTRHSNASDSEYVSAPQGPSWKEVCRLLRAAKGTTAAALRARAVLSLCSVYGLRSSEVARLRLSDFNWRDEIFTVQRAKRGRLQRYPDPI
jgi:integrase